MCAAVLRMRAEDMCGSAALGRLTEWISNQARWVQALCWQLVLFFGCRLTLQLSVVDDCFLWQVRVGNCLVLMSFGRVMRLL
jgi:hypothetical protein